MQRELLLAYLASTTFRVKSSPPAEYLVTNPPSMRPRGVGIALSGSTRRRKPPPQRCGSGDSSHGQSGSLSRRKT